MNDHNTAALTTEEDRLITLASAFNGVDQDIAGDQMSSIWIKKERLEKLFSERKAR